MAGKRYFWIKLMNDFFDKTDVRLIERKPNGKEIVLLYLKLLCKAVEPKGYLLFNGRVYNEEIISMITDTDIEIVKSGIAVFEEFGLIERRDNVFYMPQIEDMMETETYWAEVKRKQRKEKREREATDGLMNDAINEKDTQDKPKSKRGSSQYGLGFYRGKEEAVKDIQRQIDELKEQMELLLNDGKEIEENA